MIHDKHNATWQIWKLIPVKVESAITPSSSSSGNLDSGPLPLYDGGVTPGQSTTRTQYVESERDDLGTIVNEVTVVTSTVTTHNRYRVLNP